MKKQFLQHFHLQPNDLAAFFRRNFSILGKNCAEHRLKPDRTVTHVNTQRRAIKGALLNGCLERAFHTAISDALFNFIACSVSY